MRDTKDTVVEGRKRNLTTENSESGPALAGPGSRFTESFKKLQAIRI